MNQHILALTVTVCAALLALISAVVWSGYRRHHYLLWLSAALLLGGVGYLAQTTAPASGPWHWLKVLSLLAAAVLLVQAMVMRFGRQPSTKASASGAVLVLLGSLSGPVAAGLWQPWAVALGLGVLLGQVLVVTRQTAPRHRIERVLLRVYALMVVLAMLAPWSWTSTQWWAHGLRGVLVLLAAALLPALLVMCVLNDGVPRSRSGRDGVTGLLTEASFATACGERPAEQDIRVMLLCSLDQLPQLRQQHGSRAADRVLGQFAQLLQSNLRAGDWLAYISADELAMALRHVSSEEAVQLLQRFRKELRQQHWLAAGPPTASFGMVEVRESEPYHHALHRAYVLLGQAKAVGHDCLAQDAQSQERVVQFKP